MVTNDQIRQASEHLNNLIFTQWVTDHFLSPTWFVQVLLLLISYALFFYFLDRKRFTEILLFGSLVAMAFTVYDSIGEQLGLWEYLKMVLPFTPNIFLGDVTLMPLYAMLVYQYTFSWKKYLQWSVVWAGLFVFVIYDFLFDRLDIFHYLPSIAKYLDFSLFLLVAIIARGIMVVLLRTEVKQGKEASWASLSNLIAQPAMKQQKGTNDDDR